MKYPVFQIRDMGYVTSNLVTRIPYDNQICQKQVRVALSWNTCRFHNKHPTP